MPAKNPTLHGNAPDKSTVAILLIDVINDLEFPEGEQLLEHAVPMAKAIAALKQRARQAGVPVVYVNDNFGRWQSNFNSQVEHCLRDGVRGQPVVELLRPDDDDYFVLKPKHSGFFSTALDVLLRLSGSQNAGPHRNSCEHLRAVHGQRRLHARFSPVRAARLRGFEHAGRESRGPRPNGKGAEGRHSAIDGVDLGI